jgi:hypothetical protein
VTSAVSGQRSADELFRPRVYVGDYMCECLLFVFSLDGRAQSGQAAGDECLKSSLVSQVMWDVVGRTEKKSKGKEPKQPEDE